MHGKLLEHTKAQNKYYMKAFCQGKKNIDHKMKMMQKAEQNKYRAKHNIEVV